MTTRNNTADHGEGWQVYPIRGERFEENLETIVGLIGSTLYEYEQRGTVFYIRRIGG